MTGFLEPARFNLRTGFNPGGLGDKTDPGTPDAFAGSLAAAIDKTLHDLIQQDTGKDPYPLDGNSPDTRARRALCVAIAQGVLQHLHDNVAAGLTVVDGQGAPCTVTIQLASP